MSRRLRSDNLPAMFWLTKDHPRGRPHPPFVAARLARLALVASGLSILGTPAEAASTPSAPIGRDAAHAVSHHGRSASPARRGAAPVVSHRGRSPSPARSDRKKAPAKVTGKDAHKRAAKVPAGGSDRGGGLPFALERPANVTPNQEGKIVTFPFRNDDGGALSRQVGQLLAARGLEIMTDVKPVDSAEQFRDMATALHLAAYVDGDVRGTDASTRATVRLRSGYTGRKVAEISFKETRENLPREISDRLWAKLGPAVAHVCVDAGRPRKKSRSTLEINAGTPIETVPNPRREHAPGASPPAGPHAPARKPSVADRSADESA